MAGIIGKIGDALHIGGDKKADEHKKVDEHKEGGHYGSGSNDEHKKEGEHKEGFMEKIKDKISGDHKEGEDAAAVTVIRSLLISSLFSLRVEEI
ncbi:hypothetical protein MKW98_024476 [Papaver atlanticum]|uniref:Uncharacterized protein n=1 Tax=Papaver atlanticum TaxID=357466 RepID=A0AAD4S8W1_9MAGN|nr:hypothetical protein MKW98_024476 [Papaver atlanticum]